jgi:hypothetical protein
MSAPKNELAAYLRNFAKKLAADGSPDRMTVADGQGGISTHQAQPKKDPGEEDVKADQPADGKTRTAASIGGSPDRMTVADGQGGISTQQAQPTKDPGEAEVKADQPADGTVRKSARIENIRAAILGKQPASAPATQPAEKSAAPTPAPQLDLSQDTLAKIATAILSTEDGIEFTHRLFEKEAGAAAAREQIMEAIAAAEHYDTTETIKSAAYADVFEKAAGIETALSQIITEDDADDILKTAQVHQEALASLEDPMLKMAYAQGMDDAALMEAADEAGEAGEGGDIEGALPMGGEDLSEEDVLALLEEMIAEGLITKEDVDQAIQMAGSGEGAPPEAPPAE